MYHPTVSVPSEAVWEGVGDKGESTELVLDCYLFGYGCHRDSVGVPAKANEGAYGRACVASVLAILEKEEAENGQSKHVLPHGQESRITPGLVSSVFRYFTQSK